MDHVEPKKKESEVKQMICVKYVLFPLIILNTLLIISSRLLYNFSYGRSFQTVLIDQVATQLENGCYEVWQKLSFQPLLLMECNIHERSLQLKEIPSLGTQYEIMLTNQCQSGAYYYHVEVGFIATLLSVCIMISFIIIWFKNFNKMITYIIFILINLSFFTIFVFDLSNTLFHFALEKPPLPSNKEYAIIHSKELYLNSNFQYCYWLNATVSCGENVKYQGPCFNSYENALNGVVSNECYFDDQCNLFYPWEYTSYDIYQIVNNVINLLIPLLILYLFGKFFS